MKPLGLYIHWPFCLSKCPYCDFNSHVRKSIDQRRWKAALLQELEHAAQETAERKLVSIFFGGGTPSLMDPDTVGALISRAQTLFKSEEKLEITLEANPSTVEIERFKAFAGAGVNRLSIGVQSFNDQALSFLGRRHSASEALNALVIANEYFPRFSFDLIYALPNQTKEEWKYELCQALKHAKGHLSLYQLTIEPQTQFATRLERGEKMTLEEDPSAELYEFTEEILESNGYIPYEVSNYAIPSQECLHNLLYWRFEDYIGIGPGAHGRITQGQTKFATFRSKAPETWLQNVEENGNALEISLPLSPQERFEECVLMGLRLTEGLSLRRLQEETGLTKDNVFDSQALSILEQNQFLNVTDTHIIPTFEGRLKLNGLLHFLLGK